MMNKFWPGCVAAAVIALAGFSAASEPGALRRQLSASPFKIVHECYFNDNWDLFVMNADGSEPANLTNTPKENELYPQVSPDGAKICFVLEQGTGRDAVRSVYYMDIDGRNRKKVAEYARQPFWSPDSKTICYLEQEYPKFNVIDYYTKGIVFYELATGKSRPHPNSQNLRHLYNPNFSANGKWIVATVHAGMGYDHAILLIEAQGQKIINLKIPGCRPCFSPDGQQIAWGAGDHEIAAAPIDLDADEPKVGERRIRILDEKLKIYHVDWSPDGRFLSFSRGPDGEGDLSKPGTHHAACEIVGVHAQDWNLCAVSAERNGILDLKAASEKDLLLLTTNGWSNKEPAWFRPQQTRKAKE